MGSLEDLRGRVAAHLSKASGVRVEVRALTPLAGGACQDNLRVDAWFEAADAPHERTLVLRADARASLPGSLDRKAELAVIEAASRAGVRTPRAQWLAKDLTREGAHAYFLDFVPGEALGRKVVAHPSLEAARAKLPAELVAELAKIHAITPATHAGLLPPLAVEGDPVRSALAWVKGLLGRLPGARPALELALAWLWEHAPAEREVTLVHGDFRTGNFLVAPTGLAAVLDWEFAHWGSPLEDLAWLCVRDWRFGRLDLAAGGLFRRAELVERYERATGRKVAAEALRWWEVFGNVRWAAGAAFQGERARAEHEPKDELELLAVARRAGEMELEALRLIRGEIPAPPDRRPEEARAKPAAGDPAAIGQALARFLEGRVRPLLADPALSFRALVASGLAQSLAAEARDPGRALRELERLRELVPGAPDLASARAGLVQRIRDRSLDPGELDRAFSLVLASLCEWLAVTSPRFVPEARVE